MITILFIILFGRHGKSEMQWHGNDYVRRKTEKFERKWIGILILIDLLIFIVLYLK